MENTVVNKVVASGRCVAIRPFGRNEKLVTLLCRDRKGEPVFPQFMVSVKKIDDNLLHKNLMIEGHLWNRAYRTDAATRYKTSLRGDTITECPNILSDLQNISDKRCTNHIDIYLQGKVTTLRATEKWTTCTIDTGTEKHNPIRVNMNSKIANIKAGDEIKCVGTLLTPRKERDGKMETYNNIIALGVAPAKE